MSSDNTTIMLGRKGSAATAVDGKKQGNASSLMINNLMSFPWRAEHHQLISQ
jgi:hypothetical protein